MRKILAILSLLFTLNALAASPQWNASDSNQWFSQMRFPVGCNFIPSTAVNQLEMWQADTFDPVTIDRELALAQVTGFSMVRVFLHDLAWQEDQQGFTSRVDQFLTIAAKYQIKPLFVLFDSCWNPHPKAGVQPAPIPGVHNSQWVQSPGIDAVLDPTQYARLQSYVTGIVAAFAHDPRIFGWDVWNEPDNVNTSAGEDTTAKVNAVQALLPQVFAWVRAANPVQPLTSAVWNGDWTSPSTLRPTEQFQVTLSDFITFHSYTEPNVFENQVMQLEQYQRPIVCTEYMARTLGSTVQSILPVAKMHNVGAVNWGFVAGKTQTYFPWDSWQKPYTQEPNPWFHDLYRGDDTPYSADEIAFIQKITQTP